MGMRTFKFSSGNANHFQGFGEWIIVLNSDNKFFITHNVCGVVKDYGNFLLTEKENSYLWKLISEMNIEEMRSSTRNGVPDEPVYTFRLIDKTQTYTAGIWGGEIKDSKEIVALINQIRVLIEKYAKKIPYL